MRYLFISDIHSNLPALDAVLMDAEGRYDSSICLGDIIEFNRWPDECILSVKENIDYTILGNHEHWALNGQGQDPEYIPNQESMEYIRGLDVGGSLDGFLFLHANPADNKRCEIFINSIYDAQKAFNAFDENLCFVGHSHSPKYFVENETVEVRKVLDNEFTKRLEDGCRHIIDVGSVGQLYDREYACYVIYDGDSVTWRRVKIP